MGAVRQGDSVSRPARDSTTIAGSSSRQDKPSAISLRRHIQRFPQASVLVICDLIIDHYVWGRVTRISAVAPVPVVHVESESVRLGGAANVFNNILALGGKADLCGMIAADEAGRLATLYSEPVPFSDHARLSTVVYLLVSLGVLLI